MAVGYGKIPGTFDCLDNVDDEKQLTKIRINLYITNLSTILIDISSRKTKFLKGDKNATSASKNICFHKVNHAALHHAHQKTFMYCHFFMTIL